MVFRTLGMQFAGATQLLPHGICQEQAAQAMQTFAQAAKAQLQADGGPAKIPSKSFAWKEYRTKTKNVLVALGNCLQQALPEGFTFQSCCPTNRLLPRTGQAERFKILPQEKQALGLTDFPEDTELHFIYNFQDNGKWLDFIGKSDTESLYKLCFSSDEGTEVHSFVSPSVYCRI